SKSRVRHSVNNSFGVSVLTCREKQDTFLSLVEDSAVDDVGFDTGDRDGVSLACFVNDLVSVTRCGRRREDHLTANVGKVRETVAVSWGIFGDHPHVLLDRTIVCL